MQVPYASSSGALETVRHLNRRVQRLETRFGVPEDVNARAMSEAVRRASYDDVDLLFGAFGRLGLKGVVEAEVLHPLLDGAEAAVLERLCELCDEILEEWGLDG